MTTRVARRANAADHDAVDSSLAWSFAAVALPLLGGAACLELTSLQRTVVAGAGVPFAVAALVHGWRHGRRRLRVRREQQRAAAEWPTLCRELVAASRAGLDLDPLLRQLGYHEAATRRRLGHSARQWGEKVWPPDVAIAPPAGEAIPSIAPFVTMPRRVRLELDEPPVLQDPALRLAGGGLLAVVCLLVMLQAATRLGAWFCFGAAIGVGMCVGGVEALIRRVQQRREIDRALREWDQLAAAAAAARAGGGSLVELLQSRGYRVYEVRQWLLRHLEA